MESLLRHGKHDAAVHFIGIGGISMSGLAQGLHDRGCRVTGSDAKASDTTDHLQSMGIKVHIGHDAMNLSPETDLVVYTGAVPKKNPELLAARAIGIKTMDRAAFIGEQLRAYDYPICVSGAHGKTTVTSMLSTVFVNAGKDPTISVGGQLDLIGGNYRQGDSDYFILESCEHFDSFLQFHPYIGIILNIDKDHIDHFGSLDNIVKSFGKFARNIREGGTLVICNETNGMDIVTEGLNRRIVTYGLCSGDIYARNITYDERGCATFEAVDTADMSTQRIRLNVPGEHNVKNALAVFAASVSLGLETDTIAEGLGRYTCVKRRFETKGCINGLTVVDEYAHHPTEIHATLKATAAYKKGRLICAFQPHTYSRTYELLNEFAACFDYADIVIIQDIYAVEGREINTNAVSSKQLADLIRERFNKDPRLADKKVFYMKSFAETTEYVLQNFINNDIFLTIGAGDVYLVGEKVLQNLSTRL